MDIVLVLALLAATSLPGGEHYLAGRDAERSAKYADAIEAYKACAAMEGPLMHYAHVRMASCRAASGDVEGAIAEYRSLIEGKPPGPWQRMAQAYLASVLMKEQRHKEAAALFSAALPPEAKPWWVERYDRTAAENLLGDPGTREQGYAFFRNVISATLWRDKRLDAADRLVKSAKPEDKLLAAFAIVKSGARADGLKLLLDIAPEMAGGDSAADRWKQLTESFTNRNKDTAEVHPRLREAIKDYPKNAWVRVWLAYLVRNQSLAGDFDTAEAACGVLREEYPGTMETGEALGWLAYRLARNDELSRAIDVYLDLADSCPEHRRADDALLNAAKLQQQMKQNQRAEKTLLSLVKNFPESPLRANAWYLAAKIQEAAGKRRQALENYTNAMDCGVGDYYAHRALEHLVHEKGAKAEGGKNLRIHGARSFLRPFPAPSDPPMDLPDKLLADARFQRLDFFGTHGLEEGEWEALGLEQQLESNPIAGAFYQILGEAGLAATAMDYAAAFNLGMKKKQPSTLRLRVEYPRAYWPHVLAIAKETGLDPYLLLAVARQESRFCPALTSYAGASGVMQVMPPTAKWLAKVEPNIGHEHVANLEAPLNSLRLGAYYLMRMLERCDGNLVYALASYNAGPGNCSKWRKRFPNADLETFVESIPFSETRSYVKIVLANYAAYYSLYPPVQ